jgi:cyclic pyranopterin phosphate synthase
MRDKFNREITYLRISVTDRCNLRCKYCMPEEGVEDIGHNKILSFENIQRIVEASAKLGITKYRITGGEPLVRKDIIDLVRALSKIPGVKELVMTTNGILLPEKAEALKEAGLKRVNISLDTLDPEKFAEITRGGDLNKVLAGIKAAEKAGLVPLKINAVAMRGFNDDEITSLADITKDHEYNLRFIELMPFGNNSNAKDSKYLSNEEIKSMLPTLTPLGTQGVAEVFKIPGALGTIGFISAMSRHFCGDCNKIRLTSDGKLKTCLHSNQEIDLNEVLNTGDDELLKATIENAIMLKEERHHLNEGAQPITRNMNKIGG